LKVKDENCRIRIRIRIHRSEARIRPDLYQNVTDPQHCNKDRVRDIEWAYWSVWHLEEEERKKKEMRGKGRRRRKRRESKEEEEGGRA
jgi:hypothetical protein